MAKKKKVSAKKTPQIDPLDTLKGIGPFNVKVDALVGEVGGLKKDGTVDISEEKLEELKKALAEKGIKNLTKVKFIALNAPFKRRSPAPPPA